MSSSPDQPPQDSEAFETRLNADPPESSSSEFETRGPVAEQMPSKSGVKEAGGIRKLAAMEFEKIEDSNPMTPLLKSADHSTDAVPALVGRYFILEPLGVGGMGQVFLAEQRVPVKRLVALKLIKPGMDSREVLKRFDAERQALAMMDHPSIARILDAGDTADGRPYFAMELVRGKPLTEYCDQQRLNLRQRLDLFVQVCDAVQHAHQKGVLHRDLKPSNILVAEVDGTAIPKVIDFGLAKALQAGPGLSAKGATTRIGQVLGTLKYMSPEQADLDEIDIDTRTDIYALGVILYELLTGTTPLDESSLRGRALVKLLEIVRTNEPVKPSSKLISNSKQKTSADQSQSSVGSTSVTDARRTDVRRLKQILLGDLDWITMKAIEHDRQRRYQTASGFADDVRRFLTNQPVLARPPSFAYWVNKSVRRHKLAAASLLMIVACLGVAISGLAYGLSRSQDLARFERNARVLSESQRAFEQAFLPRKYQLDDFTYQDVNTLTPLIQSIAEVDPSAAEVARADLLRTYGLAIKSRIEDNQATQADLQTASDELRQFSDLVQKDFAPSFTDLIADLNSSLQLRKTNWQTVTNLPQLPAAESITLAEGLGDLVGTRLAFNVNMTSLQSLTFFELAMLEKADAGYFFRIATSGVDDAAAPTFAEAMRDETELVLSINRGFEPLAIQKLKVPLSNDWRVVAEVDDGRLVFQVNKQSISLRDIFSVSAEGARVRMRASVPVSVDSLTFEVKQRPKLPRSIDTADFHFVDNELVSAANLYAQSKSLEAQFKLALCRMEQTDLSTARQIFANVFDQPKPVADDVAIWHLLSGMWLYILDLDSRNYNGKRDVLNRLVSTYPGRLSQFLPLVPLRLKQRLLADLRKDGPRWTISLQTDTDILQLRFAGNMDSSSATVSPRRLRGTRWRLADALRCSGRLAEAEEILLDLLQSAPSSPDGSLRERVALVVDLIWLYTRQGKFNEAARLLESQADLDSPDLSLEQAPLLTEQARIDLTNGDLQAADKRMKRFFAMVQPIVDRLSASAEILQSSPIPHAAYSDACLIAGMIASDQGEVQIASKQWQMGLRKNWPFWNLDKRDAFGFGHQLIHFQASLTNEAILHSLTGGSRAVDLEEGLRAELGGKRGGRDDIFVLTQVLGYASYVISPVVRQMFDVPELGQRWRREMILRQVPLKEYFVRPIPLLMYRFVRIALLIDPDLSSAIEQEGFDICRELVEMHDNDQLSIEEDFSIIVNFIKAPLTEKALETLVHRYPPRIVGGLAYLALKRAHNAGELETDRGKRFLNRLIEFEEMPAAMAADMKVLR